jgi:hypothetical protein
MTVVDLIKTVMLGIIVEPTLTGHIKLLALFREVNTSCAIQITSAKTTNSAGTLTKSTARRTGGHACRSTLKMMDTPSVGKHLTTQTQLKMISSTTECSAKVV